MTFGNSGNQIQLGWGSKYANRCAYCPPPSIPILYPWPTQLKRIYHLGVLMWIKSVTNLSNNANNVNKWNFMDIFSEISNRWTAKPRSDWEWLSCTAAFLHSFIAFIYVDYFLIVNLLQYFWNLIDGSSCIKMIPFTMW